MSPRPSGSQLNMRPTSVYKLYDVTGRLLYVGVTSTLQRLIEHNRAPEWFGRITTIRLEHYANREEALRRERELIASERPPHNVLSGTSERALSKLRSRMSDEETAWLERQAEGGETA